jgi:uncharacterized membrane protein
VRLAGRILIGVQLVGMLVLSTIQYGRYALTMDFAGYSQAWWKIAHGRLDPWSTVFNTAFWRNDAEFLMWPLALLSRLDPHPVVLLWAQDVVVAATEFVVLGWVVEVVVRSGTRLPARRGVMILGAAALALALDPWALQTVGFDFHFETFAALFVVLAGRDLWAGRTRRLWLWAPLTLASSVLGGLYLLGIGLSGIAAGGRARRPGVALSALGLGAFLALSTMGAAGLGERLIDSGYAYLVGPHAGHVGVAQIGAGVLLHSGAVAHLVAQRWPMVFEFLVVMGLVGVVSPWGFGMALVVFAPRILNADPRFLRLAASFQSWPALPFVLVGSVMVLIRLSSSTGVARKAAVATGVVWVATMALVGSVGLSFAGHWITVDGPAAAQLLDPGAGGDDPGPQGVLDVADGGTGLRRRRLRHTLRTRSPSSTTRRARPT